MKNRMMLIAAMMLLALSLAGCGKENVSESASVENDEEPIVNIDENKSEELTEDELSSIQEKLNSNEYNGFLNQGFDSPEKIDWGKVFYNGAEIASTDIPYEEIQAAIDKLHWKQVYGDASAIARKDMVDYIKSHTGMDTDAMDLGLDKDYTYLEEYDKYYLFRYDANYVPFKCVSGIKSDDLYQVTLQYDEESEDTNKSVPNRTLTFINNAGVYEIHSNIIDFETGSDSEQSFDVDLGAGGTVKVYTYQEDSKSSRITLVKDGNSIDDIIIGMDFGDDRWSMAKINAIGFVDYNLDGYNDMIVIGDVNNSPKVLIYPYNTDMDYYIYMPDESLSSYVEDNISNYTISDVKKCLLGEYQNSAKDWKAAYKQIVRICDIQAEDYELSDMTYDLIDVDGDNMLELVTDNVGYGLSLYTYKDDHLVCLMNDWGYGAFGNYGYEYAPGKNLLLNYNTDYAGALGKSYYMTIQDDEIVTAYWTYIYNFNDKNNNGEPDEDEYDYESDEMVEGKIEYFADDESLSEEQIKNKIAEFDGYTYEGITGTKTKDMMYQLLQ